MAFFSFMQANMTELILKIQEQCYLVGISVFFAILIGIPIGIFIHRNERLQQPILGLTAILWTIPSLSLLAFLVPIFGIGTKPAIIVLTIYALLPIVRNTDTGLNNLPDATVEAARGLGFTAWQSLFIVELPLALPVIITGIRTAVAISIGVATLAAFIGAGGLGDFINRGLATNNGMIILLGAIPAAVLALLIDYLISHIERLITHREKRTLLIFTSVSIIVLGLFWGGHTLYASWTNQSKVTVRVATKNFTEQIILGEMIAQLLEQQTDLRIVRKFNLGSTPITHQAMIAGSIDIYPEYTGTGYLLVLKKPLRRMPARKMFQIVKKAYREQFNIVWLEPFGFNNQESVVTSKTIARRYGLEQISDLIPYSSELTIGATAEATERPDALPGLYKIYGIKFKAVKALEPGLVYTAMLNHKVDLIMAFSTDSRIPAYRLVILKDDKHFFPPYYAAPLVRADILKAHPEIGTVLAQLTNKIDKKTMQHLNYEVDMKKRSPASVAREFLQQRIIKRPLDT